MSAARHFAKRKDLEIVHCECRTGVRVPEHSVQMSPMSASFFSLLSVYVSGLPKIYF